MTINLEENAHAKAQRGQDAKEEKQASSSLPLRLRPFAPLREPSAPSPFLLGLLVGLTAVLAGIVLGFGGPVAGAAVAVGGLAAVLVLRNQELGFFAVIAVVALLPFATLPFDIGLTPTFLDFALGLSLIHI